MWGYHPLVVSLSNAREVLYLVNRPGNAVSHEGAAAYRDRAIALVRESFQEVWLRGDTDFSLTEHLDRWTRDGVKFVLGYDAMPHLVERAQALPQSAWQPLERPTPPRARRRRQRRPRVKERIVKEKGYKNIRLNSGQAAEFPYRPGQCAREYRTGAVRKNLGVEKGEDGQEVWRGRCDPPTLEKGEDGRDVQRRRCPFVKGVKAIPGLPDGAPVSSPRSRYAWCSAFTRAIDQDT